MHGKSIRCVLVGLAVTLLAQEASARIPPPPVPLDVVLKQADRIVVGRVRPGSVTRVAGADRKESYTEFTLLVVRSLDGKNVAKEITVTMGSFPAKVFPASKTHPQGRFLLTGWNDHGYTEEAETGLDLCAEQVWFLQRFRDDRLRNPTTAPHGVDHANSVENLVHAGLIELFTQQASVAKLRKHLQKAYDGKIPLLAVQGFYGSSDPGAGALVWDYLQEFEALAKARADRSKKNPDDVATQARVQRELDQYRPYDAFRTLNSLGRAEALKWTRKSLHAKQDFYDGALETLKRYQDIESVPRLLELLKNATQHDHRERLIATLGEIGDARAVPALLDCLPNDTPHQHVQRALFQLTDIRFSPNGDYAKRWWERNKDKPRWHWLKQGIEQDLHLLDNRQQNHFHSFTDPLVHLMRVTCWRQGAGSRAEVSAAWAKWWEANKDLPQERWILDSFKAVGHPLPDLSSNEAVDALVKAYNTPPDSRWDKGPVLDPHLHHVWCQRLLTRLTGWDMEDTHYVHYSQPDWYDYQKFGPKWQTEWHKSRYGVKIRPIDVPAKQPFTMTEADRALLCDDFDALRGEVAFKGPLVRKMIPGLAGLYVVGTFELTVTNRSARELTLHTKPGLNGESGHHQGQGGSLSSVKFACTTHTEEFATLRPGESIRWIEQERLHYWSDDQTWLHFRLQFHERGKTALGWRGQVATPWIPVKKENIRDE